MDGFLIICIILISTIIILLIGLMVNKKHKGKCTMEQQKFVCKMRIMHAIIDSHPDLSIQDRITMHSLLNDISSENIKLILGPDSLVDLTLEPTPAEQALIIH